MTEEDELREALGKIGLPGNIIMDMVMKLAQAHYYRGAREFADIISLSYGEEGKQAVQTVLHVWEKRHKAEMKALDAN